MKHLSALFYSILMTVLLSSQLAFASDNLVTFAIDKKVYNKMSSDQRQNLSQQIQDLNTFVEEVIKKKIPDYLLEETKDLKIKISFTDRPGRDGLFTPQESGEHVITVQLVQVYSNGIKALLAHEIFHAIHYKINPDESPWVREGMAQLFEYITTNDLNGKNLAAAITNPMTPLLGSYDVEEVNAAQYGHNQLYFYYLYNHCGKDNFFWKMAKGKSGEALRGSYLIDAILLDLQIPKLECQDFAESAITFEVAKAHNKMQFLNAQDKEKFYLYAGDIEPKFLMPVSVADLKLNIDSMPVLSSFKMKLKNYIEYQGECKNCAIFYADRDFPYSVSETMPQKAASYDVILVKLRRN